MKTPEQWLSCLESAYGKRHWISQHPILMHGIIRAVQRDATAEKCGWEVSKGADEDYNKFRAEYSIYNTRRILRAMPWRDIVEEAQKDIPHDETKP